MKISLFSEKITIQKNATVVDAIGNHTNGWEDYFSCHATVSGTSGQKDAAAQTLEDADVAFSVRYCEKTSVVDAVGYRIIFRRGIYDIVAVDYMNFKKKLLKFRCRKVRR